MPDKKPSPNRHLQLVERIFFENYQIGIEEFYFQLVDLEIAARERGVSLPEYLGEVFHETRFRLKLLPRIRALQPERMEWIIEGAGRAKYLFKLVRVNRIAPNPNLIAIRIPDATPDIIPAYPVFEEQTLLARMFHNRLLDIFLGIVSYPLQDHLRTTIKGIGQIGIDEIFLGIDRRGSHYVIPVQARGRSDQLSIAQTRKNLDFCAEKFPSLICRAISTQFISDDLIAVFELDLEDDQIRIVDEKHYRLVPAHKISDKELKRYAGRRNV